MCTVHQTQGWSGRSGLRLELEADVRQIKLARLTSSSDPTLDPLARSSCRPVLLTRECRDMLDMIDARGAPQCLTIGRDLVRKLVAPVTVQLGVIKHPSRFSIRHVRAHLQQKETWAGVDKTGLNREQSGSTKITGWSDLPSETHNAQPLGGWDVDLRDVLKASKKYTDSHHGQQLDQPHQCFELSGIERVGHTL